MSRTDALGELLPELVELRQALHRVPELAGLETRTGELVRGYLSRFTPDRVLTALGGTGLAAVYEGTASGPTVLFRAELDAVPVAEPQGLPHCSLHPGVAHKCGHDGHLAAVAGLAPLLHRRPPERGRVVLLFQPAEETGEGAARVLDDSAFAAIAPDFAFAIHNLPGYPMHAVVVRDRVFSCASVGLAARLVGSTAQAATPELGLSPAGSLVRLMRGLPGLTGRMGLESALLTVIHARLGDPAFGTSPGEAELMATLRAESVAALDRLREAAVAEVRSAALDEGLGVELTWVEPFPATINDPQCTELVRVVAERLGLEVVDAPVPFRWSEDFGHFTARGPGTLFGLGAGTSQPPLHHPHFDFPDVLLQTAVRLYAALIEQTLGERATETEPCSPPR